MAVTGVNNYSNIYTNAYTGMCDDIRMAVSVIFYLQNSIDYMTVSYTHLTLPTIA